MLNHLKNKRGVALLVSLGLIAVLVPVVIEANRNSFRTVEAMATTRYRHSATYIAKFGIKIAMVVLIHEAASSMPDSIRKICEDTTEINEILAEIPFDDGRIQSLKIEDELGKIQINSLIKPPGEVNPLQEELWDRALRRLVEKLGNENEINETRNIIECVEDFLDENDDMRLNGAEKDYYEDLEPPVICNNDYFTDLDELLYIKGMNPQIFENARIRELATVYGGEMRDSKLIYEGKININTAPLPVLTLLFPEGEEDKAQAIYAYRTEKIESDDFANSINDNNWYSVALSNEGFDDTKINPNLIRFDTNVFRVICTAEQGGISKTITAVIERKRDEQKGKWICYILRWKDS